MKYEYDCTQLSDKGVLYSAGKWSSRLVRSLSTTRRIREPSISALLSTQQPHAVVGPQAHELVTEFIFTSFEPPGISSECRMKQVNLLNIMFNKVFIFLLLRLTGVGGGVGGGGERVHCEPSCSA